MVERPILFSAPMVRAILAGTKTQTRRVACKGTIPAQYVSAVQYEPGRWRLFDAENAQASRAQYTMPRCPYGQPGDRLWVRETFAKIDGQTQPWIETDYRASYTHGDRLGDTLGIKKRWTPAIHMPRAASRITLEVTGVRVERLQGISYGDALAEGVHNHAPAVEHESIRHGETGEQFSRRMRWPQRQYAILWDSINGPGSWDANPWVWVVEFRRLT